MKARIILSIVVFLFAARQIQAQGISVTPMKVFFSGGTQEPQRMKITIYNPSEKRVDVKTSFSDWIRDSLGETKYFPPGSQTSSCASWVQIFPSTSFSLEPSEKIEVTVLVAPPDSQILEEKHCFLFFTQTNLEKITDKKGIAMNVAVRVGVQIFYRPQALNKKDIDITGFRVLKDSVSKDGRSNIMEVSLLNQGEVSTNGKMNIELTHLETGRKISLAQNDFYTFPGAVRLFRLPLKDMEPGSYDALAVVDYGQDQELKLGQLEFTLE